MRLRKLLELAKSTFRTRQTNPPEDWDDKSGWDRYFSAKLSAERIVSDPDMIVLRFLSLAHKKGGRIWFAGCGLDRYPKTYAEQGCKVLATDLSSVAVMHQQRLAEAFLRENKSAQVQGAFSAAEHDFTKSTPGGEFDVVINCRAFQGLSVNAMRAAAGHFYAALRPERPGATPEFD